MKTTQSVALAPQKGLRFPENILLLLLKMRTFIALFLIVGFFTITVPGFSLRAAW
jgi:erythritol transport system permease protein